MSDGQESSALPPPPTEAEIDAFVEAAANGDAVGVIAYVKKHPGFLDLRDDQGNTALTKSAEGARKPIVDYLACCGARLDATDKDGWTPLARAAQRGHLWIAEYLLKKGAPVDAKDSHGLTPLMRAAGMGHTEIARLLLENGASVEEIDFQGRKAIVFAQREGPETAKLIEDWPKIKQQHMEQLKEEKRVEAEKQAGALILAKLKSRRPVQSPFRKGGPG